jgi:AcrR family transcriptional regulator
MGNEGGTAHEVLALAVPRDIADRSRKQRILDAMAAAAAEKSFGATTIADIVAGAGISRATFYKHFPDKQACLLAALDSFIAELQAAAEDAHSPADSHSEAMREAIAAILDLLAAKPDWAKLALIEATALDRAAIDRYRRLLIGALMAYWTPDELPPDANARARAAFGQAQVLIFDQIAGGRVEQLPELLPDLVYIALLPFRGLDEALSQAQRAR